MGGVALHRLDQVGDQVVAPLAARCRRSTTSCRSGCAGGRIGCRPRRWPPPPRRRCRASTQNDDHRVTVLRPETSPLASRPCRADSPWTPPPRPAGIGRYAARIDPGWWIERGPNGGYVAALILRAVTAEVADPERRLRSFTVHYLAPPDEGPVEVAGDRRAPGSVADVGLGPARAGRAAAGHRRRRVLDLPPVDRVLRPRHARRRAPSPRSSPRRPTGGRSGRSCASATSSGGPSARDRSPEAPRRSPAAGSAWPPPSGATEHDAPPAGGRPPPAGGHGRRVDAPGLRPSSATGRRADRRPDGAPARPDPAGQRRLGAGRVPLDGGVRRLHRGGRRAVEP